MKAENQEDSNSESINTVQEELINIVEQALQEVANVITELARALGADDEKTLFKIESFRDDRI